MELYEHNTCSFIVKVWVEENDDLTGYRHWRGHITHVYSGKRQYFEKLANIVNFISSYLEEMTVTVDKPIIANGDRTMASHINVYSYPYELTPADKLMDGDTPLPMTDNTLLVWVDFQPEAKFAHNTAYLLISPVGIQVQVGQWWPELNGKRILYGARNPTALLSPLVVESAGQSKEGQ
jgi:hypothetical protein